MDDDSYLLDGLRQRLRMLRRSWAPDFVCSAAQALERLVDGQSAVVVTDWMMPGMDGLSLCKRLQEPAAEASGGRRYVIVLTGKNDVEHVVEALGHGADDYIRKPCDVRELVARIEVGTRVVRLEDRLREANERLRAQAMTDELTGANNRRRGLQVLNQELQRVARGAQGLGVALVDMDFFKRINDTRGHGAGDAVLKEAARRLQLVVREYDCVARWGGEEFLIICPGATDANMITIAERARRAICESPIGLDDGPALWMSASFGTASVTTGVQIAVERLLAAADAGLYAAKAAGRNQVCRGDGA